MGRKWANIVAKKTAKDANNSKIYAKFGIEIYAAAKSGEPDPHANQFLTQENRVELTARVGDLPKVYYANETRQMIDGLIHQIDETAELAKYWRTTYRLLLDINDVAKPPGLERNPAFRQ